MGKLSDTLIEGNSEFPFAHNLKLSVTSIPSVIVNKYFNKVTLVLFLIKRAPQQTSTSYKADWGNVIKCVHTFRTKFVPMSWVSRLRFYNYIRDSDAVRLISRVLTPLKSLTTQAVGKNRWESARSLVRSSASRSVRYSKSKWWWGSPRHLVGKLFCARGGTRAAVKLMSVFIYNHLSLFSEAAQRAH